MKFGYFDDQNKEYVIKTPKTPLPWINYLGNKEFFSLISNTGGGYTFYKDAKLMRITRYRYNDVPADCNGKYFYIDTMGPDKAIISDEIKNPNGKNILKRHQYLAPHPSAEVSFLYKILLKESHQRQMIQSMQQPWGWRFSSPDRRERPPQHRQQRRRPL